MPDEFIRRVFVTGATGAIGSAIAKSFGAAGATLAATSRSGDVPGVAHPLRLTLDDASITNAVDAATAQLGGLDTVVVNAVRWPALAAERFEDVDPDEARAVLRANVEGTFTLLRAALPALRRSRAGRIVLISSGAAEEGHPPAPHYIAAKAALHGLCRALAWDAGRDGILVNAFAVGFTRTPAGVERFGASSTIAPARSRRSDAPRCPRTSPRWPCGWGHRRTPASPASSSARAPAPRGHRWSPWAEDPGSWDCHAAMPRQGWAPVFLSHNRAQEPTRARNPIACPHPDRRGARRGVLAGHPGGARLGCRDTAAQRLSAVPLRAAFPAGQQPPDLPRGRLLHVASVRPLLGGLHPR